jgi:hypothetical protein
MKDFTTENTKYDDIGDSDIKLVIGFFVFESYIGVEVIIFHTFFIKDVSIYHIV